MDQVSCSKVGKVESNKKLVYGRGVNTDWIINDLVVMSNSGFYELPPAIN